MLSHVLACYSHLSELRRISRFTVFTAAEPCCRLVLFGVASSRLRAPFRRPSFLFFRFSAFRGTRGNFVVFALCVGILPELVQFSSAAIVAF